MKGFALLEVLVAMAVLLLAVHVIVAMQRVSLRETEIAYQYAYKSVRQFSKAEKRRVKLG